MRYVSPELCGEGVKDHDIGLYVDLIGKNG